MLAPTTPGSQSHHILSHHAQEPIPSYPIPRMGGKPIISHPISPGSQSRIHWEDSGLAVINICSEVRQSGVGLYAGSEVGCGGLGRSETGREVERGEAGERKAWHRFRYDWIIFGETEEKGAGWGGMGWNG